MLIYSQVYPKQKNNNLLNVSLVHTMKVLFWTLLTLSVWTKTVKNIPKLIFFGSQNEETT